MLLALLFACQTDATAPPAIVEPYARATPPGTTNSALFLTVHNPGPAQTITAASSPVAETVELHTHTMEGGQARMRRIDEIALPSGADVTLKPGGLHVMLIDLHSPLAVGTTVPFTLTLRGGEAISGEAPVRQIGAHHHE